MNVFEAARSIKQRNKYQKYDESHLIVVPTPTVVINVNVPIQSGLPMQGYSQFKRNQLVETATNAMQRPLEFHLAFAYLQKEKKLFLLKQL